MHRAQLACVLQRLLHTTNLTGAPQVAKRKMDMLFVRGDGVILVRRALHPAGRRSSSLHRRYRRLLVHNYSWTFVHCQYIFRQ